MSETFREFHFTMDDIISDIFVVTVMKVSGFITIQMDTDYDKKGRYSGYMLGGFNRETFFDFCDYLDSSQNPQETINKFCRK